MGDLPVRTVDKLMASGAALGTVHLPTLAVGLLALAVLFLMPKISGKVPPSLTAIPVSYTHLYWFSALYPLGM